MRKCVWLILPTIFISACTQTREEPSDAVMADPTVLIDTYEREVTVDCSGNQVSEQMVRRPAYSTIKINPDQNIYIAAVSFFNLDNGAEYTPSAVLIPGPGGDNLKIATFCQAPHPQNPCLMVHDGDNQIEYKYWSQEHPDVMGEDKIKTLHFTVVSQTSSRVCTRRPVDCSNGDTTFPSYGDCRY